MLAVASTPEVARVDDAHTRRVLAELGRENVERRPVDVLQYLEHVRQRPPCQQTGVTNKRQLPRVSVVEWL